MADVTDVQPAGVVVRFVSDGDGYEIQLENNDELADEALAALLQEAMNGLAERKETPADRARGMW